MWYWTRLVSPSRMTMGPPTKATQNRSFTYDYVYSDLDSQGSAAAQSVKTQNKLFEEIVSVHVLSGSVRGCSRLLVCSSTHINHTRHHPH